MVTYATLPSEAYCSLPGEIKVPVLCGFTNPCHIYLQLTSATGDKKTTKFWKPTGDNLKLIPYEKQSELDAILAKGGGSTRLTASSAAYSKRASPAPQGRNGEPPRRRNELLVIGPA